MPQKIILFLTVIALAFTASVNLTHVDNASENKLFSYRPTEAGKPETIEYDIAIYGGTPATQAAKLKRKVVLISHNQHVGGMTSGGLTATYVGSQSKCVHRLHL